MTKLLTQAFEKASHLSPEEQDELARWLLEELADEQRWAKTFAESQDRSPGWRMRPLRTTGRGARSLLTRTLFEFPYYTTL